jgi:Fe2+ or Zn2+ uptake regulation protein
MINKLYNLKNLQIEQQVLQKQQLLASVDTIVKEIEETTQNILGATVQTLGAISDFKILEIHKSTMKNHITKLEQEKSHLLMEIEHYGQIIMQLNKEMEQFKYIKEQQAKEKVKKLIKTEDEMANEYMESKWVAS